MAKGTVLWRSEKPPPIFGRLKHRKVWHRVERQYGGDYLSLCGLYFPRNEWDLGGDANLNREARLCKTCEAIAAKEESR